MCGHEDYPCCGCGSDNIDEMVAEDMLEAQDEEHYMMMLNGDDPIIEDDDFAELTILSPELIFTDIEERHYG